jgi:hypothetical protein
LLIPLLVIKWMCIEMEINKNQLINYVKTHGQYNANVYFSQQDDIALSQLAGTTLLCLSS